MCGGHDQLARLQWCHCNVPRDAVQTAYCFTYDSMHVLVQFRPPQIAYRYAFYRSYPYDLHESAPGVTPLYKFKQVFTAMKTVSYSFCMIDIVEGIFSEKYQSGFEHLYLLMSYGCTETRQARNRGLLFQTACKTIGHTWLANTWYARRATPLNLSYYDSRDKKLCSISTWDHATLSSTDLQAKQHIGRRLTSCS